MRLRLLTLLGGAVLIGALVVASVALAGGNPANKLHADLTGGQVVGGQGAPAGSGNARVTLRPRKQKICFRITYKKIGPKKGLNAAIYKGAKGQNGALVQTLFTGKRSSPVKGCAKNVAKADMKAIRAKPRQFHVTVKNDKYPGNGAIRGQLKQRQ
jgi:CHRD domain